MKKTHNLMLLVTTCFLLLVIPVNSQEQEFLFKETKTISDGQMWPFQSTLVSGVKYSISIDVQSGNAVDLIVFDSLNYGKYQQAFTSGGDGPFEYFVSYSAFNTKGKSYTIQTDDEVTLYFVVENAYFIDGGADGGDSADVEISLSYDPATASTSFDIFLVSIAIFSIFLFRKNNK